MIFSRDTTPIASSKIKQCMVAYVRHFKMTRNNYYACITNPFVTYITIAIVVFDIVIASLERLLVYGT